MEIICECGKHCGELDLVSGKESIIKDVDDKDTETVKVSRVYSAECKHCGANIGGTYVQFEKRKA